MIIKQPEKQMVLPSRRGLRGWQLLGVAIGAVLALTLAPATGWLVREQLAMTQPHYFGYPAYLSGTADYAHIPEPDARRDQRRDVARANPEDIPMQVAKAVREGQNIARGLSQRYPQILQAMDPVSEQLRAVRNTYQHTKYAPAQDIAVIYAAGLRYLANRIAVQRPETFAVEGKEMPQNQGATRAPNVWSDVEALTDYARLGEETDPNNAYFPAMLATVHFAFYKDQEALNDLARAAAKGYWNDYSRDEVLGQLRLNEVAFGKRSAMEQAAIANTLYYPNWSLLFATAKMVSWHAAQLEAKGDFDGGLALRGRMIRIAAMVRQQSPYLDSDAIAEWLASHGVLHLGGGAFWLHDTRLPAEEYRRRLLADYATYLKRHHYAAELAWFRRQTFAGTTDIESPGPFRFSLLLVMHWMVGLMLPLAVGVFALIGTATAYLVYRRRFVLDSLAPVPLPYCLGLVAGLVIVYGQFTLQGEAFRDFRLACLILYVALIGLMAPRMGMKGAKPFLLTLLVTLLCAEGLLELLCWQQAALRSLTVVFLGSQNNPQERAVIAQQEAAGGIMLLMALPVLFALAFGVVSRWRRVPISAGILRGFQLCSVPMCALLLFAYVGITLRTTEMEARSNIILTRIVNEGPNYIRDLTQRKVVLSGNLFSIPDEAWR